MAYFLTLLNAADADLWSLMSFGAILDQAGFPLGDVFSYTAPAAPWMDHEWGSGVFFYRLLTEWGDAGLFVVKVALFAASLLTAAAIYHARTAAHRTPLADVLFFLAGLPGCYLLLEAYSTTVRSYLLSILGYLLFLWVLDAYQRTPATRAPWLLPPLTAIWINLHGGFVVGFLVLAFHLIWLAAERRKKQATELAVVTLFCLGATLLNPYGWRLWPQVLETWMMPRAPTAAWSNVFAGDLTYGCAYAGLAAFVLGFSAAMARIDRRFPGVLLLLSLTAAAGWIYIKLVPFFVFAALALGVPEALRVAEHYDVPRRVRDLFGLLIPAGVGVAAAVLLVFHVVSTDDALRTRVPRDYPWGAISFLREQQGPVNVWGPLRWGGLVSWALYPQAQVSMDGRYETFYPEAVRADYLRFWGPDHDAMAPAKYNTTHILIPAADAALSERLENSIWVRTYEDNVSVVYARDVASRSDTGLNNAVFVEDWIGDLSRFAIRSR